MQKLKSKLTKNIFIVLVVVIIGSYSFYQTRNIIKGPIIKIESPANGITVSDPNVYIKGMVKNAAYITMNGRQIFVNENNIFNEIVTLSYGYNVLEIEVKDKFERIKKERLELVYRD
ncbi:hypothetical protein A3I18_00040 [Candidatus Campbellbacteria bacterium RIFCSPLOWO2_02_FULL_35_11]|uniref:Uncharacterized protein n=2 Tax=Candidatus Campbelliibacteriota TaxID=1752727 RepID=A0A1F5EM25_9BACT|nr:MAG: hypothetical protein A3E89_00420 [Candidatus Campbellbacteria bacterium RIFCSPHIGHO2_12_FULL_35_10]OGD70887.1 MAG: hypothetical protein A3I18_00040 [Candidatus Campbellbacteria bacterium RIFCSPLOWO2_02_FULL_35_11]